MAVIDKDLYDAARTAYKQGYRDASAEDTGKYTLGDAALQGAVIVGANRLHDKFSTLDSKLSQLADLSSRGKFRSDPWEELYTATPKWIRDIPEAGGSWNEMGDLAKAKLISKQYYRTQIKPSITNLKNSLPGVRQAIKNMLRGRYV